MDKRGFLGSILAACAAPAIARADALMRIVPVETAVLTGTAIPATSALTEAALKALIQKVWAAGGEPDIIRCGPEFARVLESTYAGAATRLVGVPGDWMPAAESVYVSDYGVSRIVVERDQRNLIVESSNGYAQAML